MKVSVAILFWFAVAENSWALINPVGGGSYLGGGDDELCLTDDDCDHFLHECTDYVPVSSIEVGVCQSKCFSGSNVVTTKTGEKLIKDLDNNDHVLTIDSDGAMKYQPVMLDIHHHPELMSEFVRVTTDDGKKITLSDKHYLYVTGIEGGSGLKAADELIPGEDSLLTQAPGGGLSLSKVSAVEAGIRERGLYNPLVASGRMMVGGVLASVYSDDIPPITPKLAHTLLWPVRQMCAAIPLGGYAHPVSGMPYWAHAANLIRSSVY